MPQSIDKLFEGVELSEEAKTKISEAFDAAVNEKAEEKANEIVADRVELLEAESKTKLEEAIEEAKTELEEANQKHLNEEVIPEVTEKVDSYLKYVVTEWVEQNKLAAADSLKVELAEKVIQSNKAMLESFGVEVKDNESLKELQNSLDEAKSKLDESLEKQTKLTEQNEALRREKVVDAVAAELELTESQKEKLVKLAEKLTFNDADDFGKKVKELSESEFVSQKKAEADDDKEGKITEDIQDPYLKMLSESFKAK